MPATPSPQPQGPQEPHPSRRRWRRRLVWAVVVLLALPLVVIGALLAVLATEGGSRWVVSLATGQAPGVELGAVEGSLLDRIVLHDLSVADDAGVWLSADRLTLDWRPAALFSGRLVIDTIGGRDVSLARPPEGEPAPDPPPQEEPGGFDPRLLTRLSLRGLDIDRLSLGAPVLGTPQPVVLAARGQATGQEGGDLTGSFAVERLDSPGEAQVDFAYAPGGRLALDAVAFEPEGGALAALLALPGRPAVRVSLNGEGPVEAWDGRLLAEAEDVATVEGDLALRLTPDAPGFGRVSLSGVVSTGPDAPSALATLARPTIRYSLQAARNEEGLRLDDLTLGSDGWTVEGVGRVAGIDGALSGRITARLTETADHPDTVLTALAGLPLGRAEVVADLGGTLQAPAVTATVMAEDTVVQRLNATLEARYGATVAFDLTGRLEGVAEDMPQLAPLTGEGLDLAVAGTAAPDGSEVTVSRLTVDARAAQVTGEATVALEPFDVTAAVEARLRDLSILAPLTGLPIGGRGRVSAQLTSGAGGRARGPVHVVLEDFALGQPVADRLLAGRVDLATDLTLDEDSLTLRDLALTAPGISAAGRLALEDWQGVDGTISLAVPQLAALDLGLTGQAAVDATLGGTLSAPQITGTAHLPEGSVQGVALSDIAAELNLTPQRLAVSDLSGAVSGAPVEGGVTMDFAGGLLDGQVALDISGDALAPFGVIFEGPARLGVTLSPVDGQQRLTAAVDGQAPRIAPAGLAARGIEAEAVINDLLGTPRGTFAVGLSAGAASGVAWSRAAVEGDLTGTEVAARLSLTGTEAAPYEASARSAVDVAGTPLSVRLQALEVTGQGHRLALAAPTTLTVAEGGALSLAETRLALDEATAVLALDFGPQRVALELNASAVPLAVAGLMMPDFPLAGHLDLSASLSGPSSGPRGQLTARSTDLALPDADVTGLALDAEAAVGGGRLTATANVRGVGDEPARLRADLPLAFSAQGIPSVPADQRMEATVDWQGPVQAVWALVPQVGHRLAGQLTLEAAVGGTPDAPRFRGEGRLRDGVYENLEFGTVLRQLSVVADLQEDGSVSLDLSATDGGDGRIEGEGRLVTLEEGASRLTSTLTLTRATLLRRDDLTATLGGRLEYSGSLDQGSLSGDLRTYGAEVRLGGGLGGGGPAGLNVVEVNRAALPEGAGRPEPEEADGDGGGLGSDVSLRIAVDIPGQIFVRGQGLDSEWRGDLLVRGTLAEPRVVGDLSVVRGTYDVIGKSFILERGVIDLRGGERVNPGLDVRAVHDADDLTAIVLVTGTADRPEITLESQPALPRDEVLARVLFGRSIADLGPAQAVGVARAASQLAGGGGSGALDITGRLRSGLGLDVLSFGGGEEGPSVEAGKYISEDVYVGVEQGAGPDSGSVNVEVEVTPRVSVKSKTSGTGESDIGIEWKFDY